MTALELRSMKRAMNRISHESKEKRSDRRERVMEKCEISPWGVINTVDISSFILDSKS